MSAGDLALQILIQALDEASPVIASVVASLDTLAPSVAAVNTVMASADTSLASVGTSAAAAAASLAGIATSTDIATQATQVLADSTSSLATVFGEDYAALNAAAGAAGPVVSSMGDMTEATIAAQAGFGDMSGSMEAAMSGFGGVGVDATLASVGMGEAATSAANAAAETANAGEASRASGYQMMMYAAIVSMAAGAFIGLGTEAQSQLAIVAGLTGTSTAMMGQYTSAVEGMSAQFGVSMANMAQGLYYVVSAGFSGAGALNILNEATMASVASGVQEEQVSHLLTGTMNAYGASADQATHYSDVLMATVTYGSQTFQDLATSFGMAATTGAGYGVSLEQMGAAEAVLTDRGITAHRAIMDLDFAVRTVMGSTDAEAAKAAGLGLKFDKTAYSSMDFFQRLQYLHQIAGNNVTDFTKLVGGAAGFGAAQDLLVDKGKLYNKILGEIEHSSGRTASAFQTAEQTMAAAGDHLKAVLSVLSYQFVQMISPIVIPIMHAITGALDWLTKHAEVARIVLFTLAGVVSGILVVALVALVGFFIEAAQPIGMLMIALGALRGLLLGLAPFLQQDTVAADLLKVALLALAIAGIAYLITMLPAIITGFIGLAVAAWTAAAGVIAATWPFLAIGAAIALLIMGLKLMYDHWTGFHNLVNASIAGLRNLWDWLVNKVGAGFSALGTWIHGTVVPALQAFWNWLSNIGALFSALGTFANAAKGPVGNFFSWLGGLIHLYIMAWGMIFSGIGTALNAAKGPVGNFFSWLGGAANTVKNTIGNIFSGLGSLLNPMKLNVGAAIGAVLKDLQTAGVGNAVGNLGKALSGLGTAFQGLGQAMQPVQAVFSAFWSTIGKGARAIQETFGPILAQLGPQFHNFLKSIGDALGGVGPSLGPILAQLGPQFHNLWNSIATPLSQLWTGTIKPILAQLGPQFSSLFKSVGDALKPLGPILAQLGPQFHNLWNSIGPTLIPGLKLLAAIIGGVLISALGLAVSALAGFVTIIVNVVTGIVKIISGIVIFFTGLIKTISGVVSFIVDLVTGHFDKLGGDLGKIWDGIKTMALGLWTAIQGAWQASIGAILSGIGTFIHSVITFFTNLYNQLVGHSIIPDMVNAIVNWFKNLVSWVINLVSGWVHGVINWVLNLKNQVVAHVQMLWTLARMYFQVYSMYIQVLIQSWVARIISWVLNLKNQVISHVLALWTLARMYFQVYSMYIQALIQAWVARFISNVINLKNQVISHIQSMVSTITSTIQGLIGNAFAWGKNLIQGFVNGIGSMIGNVQNAVGNVVNTVKHFLGFSSPTKEGPGRDADKWAPNFVNMYTQGLLAGVPKVQAAMNRLTNPNAFTLGGGMGNAFAVTGLGQPIIIQLQPQQINLDGKKIGQSTMTYAAKQIRVQGNFRNG